MTTPDRRRHWGFCLAALAAFAAPPLLLRALPQASQQTERTAIRGTVLQAGTREGIEGVQIVLASVGRGGALAQAPQALRNGEMTLGEFLEAATRAGIAPAQIEQMIAAMGQRAAGNPAGVNAGETYTVVSDNSGHFTFGNVTPGSYRLTAQREGYFVPTPSGVEPPSFSRQVTVTAAQPVPEISIELVRGSTVSGRVTDPSGRLLSNVNVDALALTYQDGRPVLQPVASNATDDRGEYRIFWVPPGEYFIAVSPLPAQRAGFRGRGAVADRSSLPVEVPVRTYYPSEIHPSRAVTVPLPSGQEMAAIDIAVRNATSYKVQGKAGTTMPLTFVTGPAGQIRGGQFALALVPRGIEPLDMRASGPTANLALDQSGLSAFEIPGVLPGSYDLVARISQPAAPASAGGGAAAPGARGFGRIAIEVNGDVDGVTFVVPPPVELKGKVTSNGAGSVQPSNVRITLQLQQFYPNFPAFGRGAQQTAAPDGTFTFLDVFQADYRVVATLPGASNYIADVRLGGISVYDAGFSVDGRSPPPLEVITNSDGGTVEGIVYKADRMPAPGITVVLVPPIQRRQNPALYKTVTSDAMGRFVVRGIAPGPYKLFAWESAPVGAYQNAAFLAQYENNGQAVMVSSASTTNAQVSLISRSK